jgi:hypothetical protein
MELIPLFPLQIVVYPLEELNLHIFEPRYRQLIDDCQNRQLEFGIPYYQEGSPLEFGSKVKLIEVSKTYKDGRMDIKTLGTNAFSVKRYRKIFPDKLYPGGYVEDLYLDIEGDLIKRIEIRNLLKDLYGFMNIQTPPPALHEEFVTFQIAHKVGFNKDQEYEFLKIIGEIERQDYMINHLNKMIPIIRNAEEMRKKIQMNGHFKNLLSPD